MTLDAFRTMCLSLRGATEDVKWGDDLVFSVGRKMFAVVMLDAPHRLSFKCAAAIRDELLDRDGVLPAPYLARHGWVSVEALDGVLDNTELRAHVRSSYEAVLAKLPARVRADILRSA